MTEEEWDDLEYQRANEDMYYELMDEMNERAYLEEVLADQANREHEIELQARLDDEQADRDRARWGDE